MDIFILLMNMHEKILIHYINSPALLRMDLEQAELYL
jgi:hypothetical protein